MSLNLPVIGTANPSLKFTEWLGQAVYAYQDPSGFAATSAGPIVEDTVKYVSEVLISGYAMTFGFPAYLIASITNSSIGDLDPVRTPSECSRGKVTITSGDSIWTKGGDCVPSVITLDMSTSVAECKPSRVHVPGTVLQSCTPNLVTVN